MLQGNIISLLEADKIILRTDKFYLCAIIIQKYGKHYLHPRIQSPEEV